MNLIKRTAIAEFVLRPDGGPEKRVQLGEPIELTPAQLDHFVQAGCVHRDEEKDAAAASKLAAEAAAAKKAAILPAADDLNALSTDDLQKIATEEQIDPKNHQAALKSFLVDLIRADRRARPRPEKKAEDAIEMRSETSKQVEEAAGEKPSGADADHAESDHRSSPQHRGKPAKR